MTIFLRPMATAVRAGTVPTPNAAMAMAPTNGSEAATGIPREA
jgi:hypothetical protein